MDIKDFIRHPKNILIGMLNHFGGILSDKTFLKVQYYLHVGKSLNLKNPQTFNEKLNWLKLYDRNPIYTTMVDKYAVKDYVKKIIGEEYIIPTLGVWDKPEDIEWNKLPSQFVLKTTHGGGGNGVLVCKDKGTFDKEIAIAKLNLSMKEDIFKTCREWPYKNVSRKIIAEQFMTDVGDDNNALYQEADLKDYKFFCFDGKVKALFVATERSTGNVKFDFFDSDFNHLDFIQAHPMSEKKIRKPSTFDEMKAIASKLSEGIPHVRVDLYECGGKVYFGELTFYHHGGLVAFHPEKWDYEFGSWLKLPTNMNIS